MGKPRIGDIETAIIQLLQRADDLYYIADEQIRPADGGIDYENLEIVLGDLGILVQYDGGAYKSHGHDKSGYEIEERWTLIAVAQNLRGSAEAKIGIAGEKGVYDILEDVKGTIVKGRKIIVDTNQPILLELLGTAVFENLFYRFGAAAVGLQIKASRTTFEYAA
jgi:hypothetical protein